MIGCNPFKTMWTKPKFTIRQIVDTNPNYRIFILSTIYGLVSLISSSQSFSIGNILNLPIILLISLILAPFYGYLVFSVAASFIYFSGKILKGEAKYKEVRAAIAWSNLPMIGNLILWLILIFIFQEDLLKDFPGSYPITQNQRTILFGVLLTQMIFSIWVIALYINSLAEVQRFSIGKAILNIIISVILFLAIFFVISIVYFLILKGISAS